VMANPSDVKLLPGAAATSTITLAGIQQYAGTVSLSVASSPSTGLTCTLSPTTVTLSASSASGQSTLSCSGSTGFYSVTVTGTSSGLTHTTSLTFSIQDYAIAANPTTMTAITGTSGSSTITVTGLQGFTGTVSLAATISPSAGLTCTLTPTSVLL